MGCDASDYHNLHNSQMSEKWCNHTHTQHTDFTLLSWHVKDHFVICTGHLHYHKQFWAAVHELKKETY